MAAEKTNHLHEVFGVSRDTPLTYVERESVDKKFVNSLARGKHITVYGGSKQGKTSLHAFSQAAFNTVWASRNACSRGRLLLLGFSYTPCT